MNGCPYLLAGLGMSAAPLLKGLGGSDAPLLGGLGGSDGSSPGCDASPPMSRSEFWPARLSLSSGESDITP